MATPVTLHAHYLRSSYSQEARSVKNSFDIMKVLSDDSLAWLEAAEELSAARIRVWELLADSPGEYIVFNQETKTLVAHFSIHETPQVSEWWRQEDDNVETPQPAVAALNNDIELGGNAGLNDEDLDDDDFAEFVHVLQPAVA
jgi:hypothetical protein